MEKRENSRFMRKDPGDMVEGERRIAATITETVMMNPRIRVVESCIGQ